MFWLNYTLAFGLLAARVVATPVPSDATDYDLPTTGDAKLSFADPFFPGEPSKEQISGTKLEWQQTMKEHKQRFGLTHVPMPQQGSQQQHPGQGQIVQNTAPGRNGRNSPGVQVIQHGVQGQNGQSPAVQIIQYPAPVPVVQQPDSGQGAQPPTTPPVQYYPPETLWREYNGQWYPYPPKQVQQPQQEQPKQEISQEEPQGETQKETEQEPEDEPEDEPKGHPKGECPKQTNRLPPTSVQDKTPESSKPGSLPSEKVKDGNGASKFNTTISINTTTIDYEKLKPDPSNTDTDPLVIPIEIRNSPDQTKKSQLQPRSQMQHNGTNSIEPPPPPVSPEKDPALLFGLFGHPLTRKQYYDRNFLWIRCRSKGNLHFDVGGSWMGPWGRKWSKEIKNRAWVCGPMINWYFEYVNGDSWGDATAHMGWFFPWCTAEKIVEAAFDAAVGISEAQGRVLYVYSCPGFENTDNYINENSAWDQIRKGAVPGIGGGKKDDKKG